MPRRTTSVPRWRRLLRAALLGLALCLALLCGYLLYLDRVISQTFEGRRWSLSSQVYAAPLELYPGLSLRAANLETELRRLGYSPSDNPTQAGQYRRQGDHFHLRLRPFQFADETRPALILNIRFNGGHVQHLADARGRPLPLVRLDPALIGSFFASHGQDRLILAPGTEPPLLRDTLILVEDRNFFQHRGFDLRGIGRAFWVNLRSGRLRQGGSTLTQQLVKSYYLDNRRTFRRKAQELAMAVLLEARFTKPDLLNAYLNEVYIGQDGQRAVHGFGLASQFYFDRPLDELGPAELALLVGVIRGPSYYNPFRHPERAQTRRDLILDLMLQHGLLDATSHGRAKAQALGLAGQRRHGGRYYPAYMDLVRQQLGSQYQPAQLAQEGYHIFTTLAPGVQDLAEQVLTRTLDQIEQERGLTPGILQAALIISHTQTGEVQALIGGRRPGFQGFNHALQGRRPIGSLIKPLIYLQALESGRYHLGSLLLDEPLRLHQPNQPDWVPSNFDNQHYGQVPLVRGLGDSLNLASVRLGLELGVEQVAQRLGTLLAQPAPPAYPSLLLGAAEYSPLEMARLYGIFASGGFATPGSSILAVRQPQAQDQLARRYPLQVQQLADPDAVLVLNHALAQVMRRGTGRRATTKLGVAGKTGTSGEFRDSWFAGFDAQRLVVIWIGAQDGGPTGLTGSSGALRVWDNLMQALGTQPLVLPTPRQHQLVSLDYAAGGLASGRCGEPVTLPLPSQARLGPSPQCGAGDRAVQRLRAWFD